MGSVTAGGARGSATADTKGPSVAATRNRPSSGIDDVEWYCMSWSIVNDGLSCPSASPSHRGRAYGLPPPTACRRGSGCPKPAPFFGHGRRPSRGQSRVRAGFPWNPDGIVGWRGICSFYAGRARVPSSRRSPPAPPSLCLVHQPIPEGFPWSMMTFSAATSASSETCSAA